MSTSNLKFDNSEFISSYDISVTSDGVVVSSNVENRLCLKTGIIYNTTGTRSNLNQFYTDEYDLHSESSVSEFQYFDKGKRAGYYDSIVEFINNSISLSPIGNVLDIGCGKGLLLNRFQKANKNWKLHAIEPSKNALEFFAQVMPSLSVFNGNFEDSPYVDQEFDFIMSNGVLEHVPDPFAFMKMFASCMKEDSYGFIGVPNFLTNPVDLFTYDHLSRFTPKTIKRLFAFAGLEVVSELSPSSRVPMWFILKKSPKISVPDIGNLIDFQRDVINKSLQYIEKAFSSFNRCIADHPDAVIAVYGTGQIINLGFHYTNLKHELVSFLVDDNSTLWGTTKFGLDVISREDLTSKGVDALVFSANPCYLPTMISKLDKLKSSGLALYIPD